MIFVLIKGVLTKQLQSNPVGSIPSLCHIFFLYPAAWCSLVIKRARVSCMAR